MALKMNNKTDLEVHIVALKGRLIEIRGMEGSAELASYLKFAILAAEQSVKLHKQH
jgi:hypothetical protein